MKDSNSQLQGLLQALPQVINQVYFKSTLTAISHAMEDLILAGTDKPLVIANFRQERFYHQEAKRYQRIAKCTDRIYVLATPETNFASAPALYPTIGLETTDELAQEWHLVIVGEQYSACLVCREFASPVDAIDLDSARQFRGFWTFDPEVSRQAALFLLQRIQYYRPDLTNQLKETRERYQLTVAREERVLFRSSPSAVDVQLFSDRLVTYLQASQYKQVKAYRRVLSQEQQEHLVNKVTAALRQSLNPETVLSVTVQEVARLFEQCRCLLYRLPGELSTSSPPKSSIAYDEYESSPPSLSSLLGKNWHLATHPQFQSILNQGNIVAIADISQDLGVQSYPDLQQQLEQAQIQACLLVPICCQQRCLAVLELHQNHLHLWSVAERDLLTEIAAQVGLALLQAEAYANLKQLNKQLITLKQTQNNLMAIVGHELRTPLSTIQICLESLATEPNMSLTFQQSMVETALADSERLRRLIQDVLLLSRLGSNIMTWQLEPINLTDSINLAIGYLYETSQHPDLPTILVDVTPDLPLAIADGETLFQILSKLLDNACKFTPPTGTITLKVRISDTLEAFPSQSILEIQIADTGCGIEPDRLETIFERFHQEENFLQRAVGGVGLGLPICQQLVRQHGGKIWATSQGKEQGSQFHVTLPVAIDK
jgi:DICT domain-containing protein/signal transduction histidine kinase